MSNRKAERYAQFVFFFKKGTAQFKQGNIQGAWVAFKRARLYAPTPKDSAILKTYLRELKKQLSPKPKKPPLKLSNQSTIIAALAGIIILEGLLISMPRVFASVSVQTNRNRAIAAASTLGSSKVNHSKKSDELGYARFPHAAIRAEPESDARLLSLILQDTPLRIMPARHQWFVREKLEDGTEKFWLQVEAEDRTNGWMEAGFIMDSKKMPLIPAQVTQSGTHLREAPDLESKIASTLPQQAQILLLPRLTMMEDNHMWFQVKLTNGRIGWIASENLLGFNGNGMDDLLDAIIAQSVETVFSGQEESYQEHYRQAITQYNTAISINQTYLNIEDAKVFAHRGNAYNNLGQCNQAMQDYAKACRHGHSPSCSAHCL